MDRGTWLNNMQVSWKLFIVLFVSSVSTMETQEVNKGENVTLMCNGKKPLNWLNAESMIIGRRKGRIQQTIYGDLFFKTVRFEDYGIYRCTSIDGSNTYKTIELQVLGKPEVNATQSSVTKALGQNATVQCVITSNPPPLYMQWLKNGKLVKETNRRKIDFMILNQHKMQVSLSIIKLRGKDFDNYECLAANSHGNETKQIQIVLHRKKPSSQESTGYTRLSPLSASTQLVISSGKTKLRNSKTNPKVNKALYEDAASQSSETVSSNTETLCNSSRMLFIPTYFLFFLISVSIFLT